jgi:hypothetical protein
MELLNKLKLAMGEKQANNSLEQQQQTSHTKEHKPPREYKNKTSRSLAKVQHERDAAIVDAMKHTAEIMTYRSMPFVIRAAVYIAIVVLASLVCLKAIHYAYDMRMEIVTIMLIMFVGLVLAAVGSFLFQSSEHVAALIAYIIPPKRIQHASNGLWMRAILERAIVTVMVTSIYVTVVGLTIDTITQVSAISLSGNLSHSIQSLPLTSERKGVIDTLHSTKERYIELAKRMTHVVRMGDTYTALAKQYGITLSELQAANNSVPLQIGDRVIIP